jgi:hypothetical protein
LIVALSKFQAKNQLENLTNPKLTKANTELHYIICSRIVLIENHIQETETSDDQGKLLLRNSEVRTVETAVNDGHMPLFKMPESWCQHDRICQKRRFEMG